MECGKNTFDGVLDIPLLLVKKMCKIILTYALYY